MDICIISQEKKSLPLNPEIASREIQRMKKNTTAGRQKKNEINLLKIYDNESKLQRQNGSYSVSKLCRWFS